MQNGTSSYETGAAAAGLGRSAAGSGDGHRHRISTVLLATDLVVGVGRRDDRGHGALPRIERQSPGAQRDRRSGQGFGLKIRPSTRLSRLDQLRAESEQKLLRIVEQARNAGVQATFLVWTGEPGQSIVSAAQAEAADLVVVGTRALDRAGRFLLGSVSDYVVNHSTCPVLIAR